MILNVASLTISILNSIHNCVISKICKHIIYFSFQFDLEVGMYDLFFDDWLKVYNLDQFLLLRTEDFKKHAASVLVEAFKFLDVGE